MASSGQCYSQCYSQCYYLGLSGVTSLFESDPIIARYADLAITKYAIRSEVAAAKETRTTEADLEMVDLSSAKPESTEMDQLEPFGVTLSRFFGTDLGLTEGLWLKSGFREPNMTYSLCG
ncbi:hypothetical protein [Acidithrix ferrooxidans]|uniref:Uncharacterized protein n=1 Tax=Acidithrix ferrooxidans TaxID=1280514 RepID=A0A0D8HK20_9ACTN|nr:hypothetical protein [Acidithrix ferrooxidans]KJF18283.1 hypothetical protein AXFE_08170 [Acidithrix ferrooxidans]